MAKCRLEWVSISILWDGELLNKQTERVASLQLDRALISSPLATRTSRYSTTSVSHEAVRHAVYDAQRYLLDRQEAEGYWVAELEGDTILESEYILLLQFLGKPDTDKFQKLAKYIRKWQHADGHWPIYPGGPPDVSASVKAYFACKIAGHSSEEAFMRRARKSILSLGGVTQCNTFTKLYLSMFDQYDWSGVPTIQIGRAHV